jgi:hypothetical protein
VTGFDAFKQSFDAWEKSTSALLETWLESPLVLEPAGLALTAMMKAKTQSDKLMALWWGSLGLPTKRDQERALHALNELESRLLDLEEKLEDRER